MASMNEKDYYAVLEVEKDATTDEIRKAFQKKARTLHPDVNKEPDAEERFKEVSEAYAVLSDDEKRRRYDAMRSGDPFAGAGYGAPAGTGSYGYDSPFGWSPFDGYASHGAGTMRSRSYNPRAGSDIAYELTLDEDAAVQGMRRGVTYQRYASCEECNGHGSVEHVEATTCPTCGGTGHIAVDLTSIFGFGVFEMQCPECEGSGKVVADPCTSCGGTGRILTASEVIIDVPADSHDGDTIRVAGMGNAGTNGERAGDFVCKVIVPAEHLSVAQESAFRMMGFAIPFVAIGMIQQGFSLLALFGIVMVGASIAALIREGFRKNMRWWQSALMTVLSGAASGVIIALLLYFSGPFFRVIAWFLPFLILVSLVSHMSRRR